MRGMGPGIHQAVSEGDNINKIMEVMLTQQNGDRDKRRALAEQDRVRLLAAGEIERQRLEATLEMNRLNLEMERKRSADVAEMERNRLADAAEERKAERARSDQMMMMMMMSIFGSQGGNGRPGGDCQLPVGLQGFLRAGQVQNGSTPHDGEGDALEPDGNDDNIIKKPRTE
jgi:hypothetical protein